MAPLSGLAGDGSPPPTPPAQWDNLSAASNSQQWTGKGGQLRLLGKGKGSLSPESILENAQALPCVTNQRTVFLCVLIKVG